MSALQGVIAATPTPLRRDFTIDAEKLIGHCRWLLGEGGCDGVNLLGTTGEATSFTVGQRIAAMRAVAGSGLPTARMMVGTGASALLDAVTLTREAHDLGFAGALLVPPFYYKGIDAVDLAGYVCELIGLVQAPALKLYLYHIPQNTGVSFTADAVRLMLRRYPDAIAGLKDSSGDIAFSRSMASGFPGFDVFPSSEGSLPERNSSCFAGCISATTNITGRLSQRAWSDPEGEAGREAAEAAIAIRKILGGYPLMASVKAALAALTGDSAWERLVPPLRALTANERAALLARLQETEFARFPEMAKGG